MKKSKNKVLKVKLIIIFSIIIFLFGLGVASYFGLKKITQVKYEKKSELVTKQLSFCQELVTAKYRYSDIVTLKKSAGFIKSYSIIKYAGIIRAGIADFTDISYDISIDGKNITLRVPPAELLGNEIISMDVFDEKRSIFVPITTQEVFDEIESARRTTVESLVDEGLFEEAREYAIKIITQYMKALGFEEVKVE